LEREGKLFLDGAKVSAQRAQLGHHRIEFRLR
jgi:hypothetical protein